MDALGWRATGDPFDLIRRHSGPTSRRCFLSPAIAVKVFRQPRTINRPPRRMQQSDADTEDRPPSHYGSASLKRCFESLNGSAPPCDLYRLVLEQVEKPLLEQVLDYSRGNQSRAAEVLGINRGTLRKKLRCYALDR